MTLPELLQHIALKERKSRETQTSAEMLSRFIAAHPDWRGSPEMTLGEVLRNDIADDESTAA
jgi:hypothetical protein